MNIPIIPARIGSQIIKKKNIVNFFGRPIISYTITILKKTKLFDKIIISTDSKKIARISKISGGIAPFVRPKKISDDKTTSTTVIKHAIKWLKKNKINTHFVCIVYATAPHIKIKNLKKGLNNVKNKKCDFSFVASQCKQQNKNSFLVNNKLKIVKKNKTQKYNYYIDAGQFYWARSSTWLKNKTVFTKNSKIIKIKEFENLDVNTELDLKKLKKYYKKNIK